MFGNILNTLIVKLTGGFPKPPEPMDWKSVVSKIQPHLESHTIFLETKNGEFVFPNQLGEGEAVISVIVAYAQEGINPWETEAPAKHMAEKLSAVLGKDLPYLLSRKAEPYAGYYVCVRT